MTDEEHICEVNSAALIGSLKRIVALIKAHEHEDACIGISDCSSNLLDAKNIAKHFIKNIMPRP